MCLDFLSLSDCKMDFKMFSYIRKREFNRRSVSSREDCQNMCQQYNICYHFSYKVEIHFISKLLKLCLNIWKESTDTENSLCVLRMSKQIGYQKWGKLYISGRKLCGKDLFSHLHRHNNFFSSYFTEDSKCMPETNIEKDFRRLSNVQTWDTCSDICNKDESCDSFNYWVYWKRQKYVNDHV